MGFFDAIGISLLFYLLKVLISKDLIIQIELLNVSLSSFNILCLVILFYVMKSLTKFSLLYLKSVLVEILNISIKKNIFKLINISSYKNFLKIDPGRIINNLNSEVDKISLGMHHFFSFLENTILAIIYISACLFINFNLTILIFLGGLFVQLLFVYFHKKNIKISYEISSLINTFNKYVSEHIINYKYLRTTLAEYKHFNKIDAKLISIKKKNENSGFNKSIIESFKEPLLILILVFSISNNTSQNEIEFQALLILLVLLHRGLTSINLVQTFYSKHGSFSGSVGNYLKLIDDLGGDNKLNTTKHSDQLIKEISSIEFKNLSVEIGEKIIEYDNFLISKGDIIKIQGESGSGKSTLINTLLGINKPKNGKILVNNIALNSLSIKNINSKIGYVAQEPVIFNDSLFNNITLWDEFSRMNIEKCKQILKNLNLNNLNLDLDLEHGGMNISGGQRQRICFAREIYKESDLLILDEVSSSLDQKSTIELEKIVSNLIGKLTIIEISHKDLKSYSYDQVITLKGEN